MKKKVLILNRFAPEALAQGNRSDELEFIWSDGESFPLTFREQVVAVIVRSGSKGNKNFLKQYPKLEFVCTSTSGFDHLDLDLLVEKNILAVHVPEPPVQSVAELTFFLILGAFRRHTKAHRQMLKGQWSRSALTGSVLAGKTLGLIGCGRIGQRVAAMAAAWGVRVVGYDPYLDSWPQGLESMGYEELLNASDILSFHVPLTRETRFMLNRSTLEKVPTHVLIVNTSRGMVIQQEDLAHFLKTYPEASAALDVFIKEPLSANSPLLELSNVFLTPHVGASTDQCLYDSSRKSVEEVCHYFEKKESSAFTLPPRSPWWVKNNK